MKHRLWRLQPHLNPEEITGQAESIPLQFPAKFPLHPKILQKLENSPEILDHEIRSPEAKKRRLRSPLASLQTTPQKLTHVKKLSNFPCSPSKMVVTPKKSAKKLTLHPFPNFVRDGTSPHLHLSAKKSVSLRKDWKNLLEKKRSTPEEVKENVTKRKTPKRARVKKSLNMNNL